MECGVYEEGDLIWSPEARLGMVSMWVMAWESGWDLCFSLSLQCNLIFVARIVKSCAIAFLFHSEESRKLDKPLSFSRVDFVNIGSGVLFPFISKLYYVLVCQQELAGHASTVLKYLWWRLVCS